MTLVALVSFLAGLGISLLIWRGRTALAHEQGRASVAVELAAMQEQNRANTARMDQLSGAYQTLQEEDQQRRDQLSQLTERARRLPLLDDRLASLEASLNDAHREENLRREQLARAHAELAGERETLQQLRQQQEQTLTKLQEADQQRGQLASRVAELQTRLEG
ncbi:MAG: hypothetical protein G3H99_00030, partial [Ferrovum sp.]|nr:hypothetical protein [Ferrovum sp.]